MLRYLRKRKAQSTVEYAILIIIIIGALLSIQVYIKRSVQGRLKQAADDIGEQYSPGNVNYLLTETSGTTTRETFVDGSQKSEIMSDDGTSIVVNQQIINRQIEFWGKRP